MHGRATDLFAFQGSHTFKSHKASIPDVIAKWPTLTSDLAAASINASTRGDDGESGSWYVDDSSELRGDGTPYDYGRESDDKGEGYDSEQREGYLDNLGNGYTEDGHEWDHRGPPEAWSDRSKGDDNESGDGGWANDEAKDGYEWSFENELEKWSNGSQGEDLRQ